jgi:hypothetical protein
MAPPRVSVTVVVADAYPNFSICGIPYYVSGEVTHWSDLANRTIAGRVTGLLQQLGLTWGRLPCSPPLGGPPGCHRPGNLPFALFSDRNVIAPRVVPVSSRVMIDGVGHKNPAHVRQASTGVTPRVRGPAGLVAVGLIAAGCGLLGPGADFPSPPRQSPVTTVLVSTDGRVITGVGGMACGHDPRLVARSYPHKVTLTWINPDTNCHAETTRSTVVRIRLAEPLGTRPLVQASGGGRIPYFDQRALARVTVLPAGFRLRSEIPAGQPVGDTRTYAGPGWPCRCAQLVIWQQVISKGFIRPAQQTSQHPTQVLVHGQVAALLINGPFYARSINWMDHGYYFTVGVAYGPAKVPLTNAQLTAVADGIRLPSSNHR